MQCCVQTAPSPLGTRRRVRLNERVERRTSIMVVYEKNMDDLFTIDFSGKGCSVELEETVRTCEMTYMVNRRVFSVSP